MTRIRRGRNALPPSRVVNARVLLALCAALSFVAACDDRSDVSSSSSSSEINARTDARRAQLARLSRVDALARLYVGHELERAELLGLGSKSEAVVIDVLVARPDFKMRFSAR